MIRTTSTAILGQGAHLQRIRLGYDEFLQVFHKRFKLLFEDMDTDESGAVDCQEFVVSTKTQKTQQSISQRLWEYCSLAA